MNHLEERAIVLWSLCSPEAAYELFDIIIEIEEKLDMVGRIGILHLYEDHFITVMETLDDYGQSVLGMVLQNQQLRDIYWANN